MPVLNKSAGCSRTAAGWSGPKSQVEPVGGPVGPWQTGALEPLEPLEPRLWSRSHPHKVLAGPKSTQHTGRTQPSKYVEVPGSTNSSQQLNLILIFFHFCWFTGGMGPNTKLCALQIGRLFVKLQRFFGVWQAATVSSVFLLIKYESHISVFPSQ